MADDSVQNSLFRELCEHITNAMECYRVPGLAVGVLHNGREYTAGFGVTSVEHPLSVDADTLFQIGSITKTFTAAIAMHLVEIGKLDLDMPVRKYLPDFQLQDEDTAAHVTTRHLLTHMGGWLGDYFDDIGDGDDALSRYVANMSILPQLTPLGTIWHYNNAGFAVVGRIIEVVTGKTYEWTAKELLLNPLGMERSFFFPKDVMTHRFVVGHYDVSDKPTVARPWFVARSCGSMGGIASTIRDMMRYARFCLCVGADGNMASILSNNTIRQMCTPQTNAALDEKMGIAWFITSIGNLRIIRHTGSTLGQTALLLFVPERNFAIVLLANSDRGYELNREVAQIALEKYLGVREPEPVQITMPTVYLKTYVGKYVGAFMDIDLTQCAEGLKARFTTKCGFPAKDSPPPPAPPPSQFVFIAKDRLLALDGHMKNLQGEFLRDSSGNIVWFRFGSRIHARI